MAGKAGASDRVEVNVGYANNRGRNAAEQAVESVKREFAFDAMTIKINENARGNLESNPNIRYAENNGQMEAHQTTPYGIEITDADIAIDEGATGDGVSVAILDTGIDAQHETLEENLGEGWATDDAACITDCGGGPFGGGNDIDTGLSDAKWAKIDGPTPAYTLLFVPVQHGICHWLGHWMRRSTELSVSVFVSSTMAHPQSI